MMIDEQERKKMYATAPLLGEPACSQLQRVLCELNAAEARIKVLEQAAQDPQEPDNKSEEISDTDARELKVWVEKDPAWRSASLTHMLGKQSWRVELGQFGRHSGKWSDVNGLGLTIADAVRDALSKVGGSHVEG